MNDESDGPVLWNEAREVVIFVLLSVVLLQMVAGLFEVLNLSLADEFQEPVRFRFFRFASQINVSLGLALVGAAILIVTAPPHTVSVNVRVWTHRLSILLTIVAVLNLVNLLNLPNPAGFNDKLFSLTERVIPGMALCALAAWLTKNVIWDPTYRDE